MMNIATETKKLEVPVKEFTEGFVDFKRTEKLCSACPGYGKTWACPPYSFDPDEVWTKYGTLRLIVKIVGIPKEETEKLRSEKELAEAYEELIEPVRAELMDELYRMEAETPGSLALSAGGCGLCGECTRGSGAPCRFPDKMRWSVESLGGDVLKCLEEYFGIKVGWAENGRLPDKYHLVGGLLIK